jgi:uncharacterized protein YceK
MKEVAILLVAVLMLNGCGTNSTATQTAAGGTWSATMLGGDETASGLSFITSFSVSGSGGNLSVSTFQFLNAGACFPVNGEQPTGTMVLQEGSNFQVTGTVSFTVQSGGNVLTLTGTVTGTENGVLGQGTLSGAVATGTWTLTGSSGCTVTNENTSFTMTQNTSG